MYKWNKFIATTSTINKDIGTKFQFQICQTWSLYRSHAKHFKLYKVEEITYYLSQLDTSLQYLKNNRNNLKTIYQSSMRLTTCR